MADPPPAAETPAPALVPTTPVVPPEPQDPSDILLKVLGVVGTGLGILGFVTFFGGAILWVRLNEAHLPATEAVSVIPNSVLVTTGAAFLAPALLVAGAVVAASFLVFLGFRLVRRRRDREQREEAQRRRHDAEAMGRDANACLQAAQAARAITSSLEGALTRAKESPDAAQRVPKLEAEVDAQHHETERLELAAQAAVSAAAARKAKADNLIEELEIKLERSRWQASIELVVGAVALIVIPLISNQAIWHVGFRWGIVLFLTLLFAAAITTFVYAQTDKFIWFGITAFITVSFYIGLSTYVSTSRNVKMQPLAALRAGHEPVFGSFIADTASNLYVGTFKEGERSAHMLVIPRAQVTELTIGPLLDPHDARERAITLALDECAQQVEAPAPAGDSEGEAITPPTAMPSAAESNPACTPEQKKALQDALATS
jgi:hypothetical protein